MEAHLPRLPEWEIHIRATRRNYAILTSCWMLTVGVLFGAAGELLVELA
jgi:hypothetical protein